MSQCQYRILGVLTCSVILTCAGSQAEVTPEAKTFLDQLATRRQALPPVTLSPYHQPTYPSGGPTITYLPGNGLRIETGARSYGTQHMKSTVYFTDSGLFSANETGELLKEAFVGDIEQLPYYCYCAPFLTVSILDSQASTKLERDGDRIHLITTTDSVSERWEKPVVPPHLIPVGKETTLTFASKDLRLLGLKVYLLQGERKTPYNQWQVTCWQDVNGVFLPREIRAVSHLSEFYNAYSRQAIPEWQVVSLAAVNTSSWLDKERLIRVSPSRTEDGIPANALPSPAVAAEYARALTAWREGDLVTAKKGFEALAATSPELIAPRVRLLELQMLSDLPQATDKWIAWLKQDLEKEDGGHCPVFLSKHLAFTPEKQAALQSFLLEHLDSPAASSIFATVMSSAITSLGRGLPQDVLVTKIETLLDRSPSPATLQTCLRFIGVLAHQRENLQIAEKLLTKYRDSGAISLAKNPQLYQAYAMVQTELRDKNRTSESWKQQMMARPSLSTEQQYELFTHYYRDREFLPAFKLAIKLVEQKDLQANRLVWPLLTSMSYSPNGLSATDKAELLELVKQDLPFELLLTALQACQRNNFDEAVQTILNRLETNNYQDLDCWQLLRIALAMNTANRSSGNQSQDQFSALMIVAMDRLPDDRTRGMVAMTYQQQPLLAETLKEYYTDIDPWSLNWNFFTVWLRAELKKAAQAPEALDKLVTTLGGGPAATRTWVKENLPEVSDPGAPMTPRPSYQYPPVDWSDPAAPGPQYSIFYHSSKDEDTMAQMWRVFKLSPLYRNKAADELLQTKISIEEKRQVILSEIERGAPMQRGYRPDYVDVLTRSGQPGDVERYYKLILQYTPDDRSTLAALHALWIKENKTEEAVKLTLDHYPKARVESVAGFSSMLKALEDDNREKLANILQTAAETAPIDNQIRLAYALSQWDQYEKAAEIFESLTRNEKSPLEFVLRIWLQAARDSTERITEQARIYRLYLERCPENASISSALQMIMRKEGEERVIQLAKKLADRPEITLEQGVDIVAFLRSRRKYEDALTIAEKVKDAPSQRGPQGVPYSQTRLENEVIECLKALGKQDEVEARTLEAIVNWTPRNGDHQLRQLLEQLAKPGQPSQQLSHTGQLVDSAPASKVCEKIVAAVNEKMTDADRRQLVLIQVYTVFDQLPKAEKIAQKRVEENPDWRNYHVLMEIVKQSPSPDRVSRVINLYEKAIKKQPGASSYQAYNLVAWVFQVGETEDVIRSVWEKYSELEPVRQNRANLSSTARRRGFNTLAAEVIGPGGDDDDPRVMTERIQILMAAGKYEKALSTIEKTRKLISRSPGSQAGYQHQNLDSTIERSVRDLRKKMSELEKLEKIVGDPGDDPNRLRLAYTIKKTQFDATGRRDETTRKKIGGEALEILEKMATLDPESLSSQDYYQLQYISREIKDMERMISVQNLLIKQKQNQANDYYQLLQTLHEANPEKTLEQGLAWAKATKAPIPFLQFLVRQKFPPEKGLAMIQSLTEGEPEGEIARQCRVFKASWLIANGNTAAGVAVIDTLDANDVQGISGNVTSQAVLDAVHQRAIPLDKGIKIIEKLSVSSGQSAYYWNSLAQANFGKANPRVALTLAEKAVAIEQRDDFLETLAAAQAFSQSENWQKKVQDTLAKMSRDKEDRGGRVLYYLCRHVEKEETIPPGIIDIILDLCQEPKVMDRYGYYVTRALVKAGKEDQLLTICLDALRKKNAPRADLSEEEAHASQQEMDKRFDTFFSLIHRERSIASQLADFVEKHPDDVEALEMLARTHERRGKHDAARDVFARIIHLRGANASAGDYYHLAFNQAQIGSFAASRENFRKAVGRSPEMMHKYAVIMDTMMAKSNQQEAMAFGRKWAQKSGEIIRFLDLLNQNHPRQPARWLESVATLVTEAKDQNKTHKICVPYQALWLLETGQTTAGINMLNAIDKQTVSLFKNPQPVALLIREAAWRSGKITAADAIMRIEKLVDTKQAKDAHFWQRLGTIDSANSDEQETPAAAVAIPFLKKAQALKPDDETIELQLVIAAINARSPGWMHTMKTTCDKWLEKEPRRVAQIVTALCRSYSKEDEVPDEVMGLVVTLLENKEINRRCSYEARKFFQRVGDAEIAVRVARKALDACEKPGMRFRYVDRLVNALEDSEDPSRIIPLLITEIPKITNWSYVNSLYSRLNRAIRSAKRTDESAAIADRILAASPAENVVVRGKAMMLKGDKKKGAKLLYDAFMADPDREKFSATYYALKSAGMYQDALLMTEKILDMSADNQKEYYRQYHNLALIQAGRTDEVIAYLRQHISRVVERGQFYPLASAIARDRQVGALNELYGMVMAEIGPRHQSLANINKQFLYCFRRAGDAEGVNKAGRALLALDGLSENHRKSYLRNWQYAARETQTMPRFCMELATLVKDRPGDTLLLSVLEQELPKLKPDDLARALRPVEDILKDDTPQALRMNARLLTKANRPDDAVKVLSVLQKNHPDQMTSEDTQTLIQAHVLAEDWEAAMAIVDAWRKKAPEDLTPLFSAARIMLGAKRQAEAGRLLAEARKRAGNDPEKLIRYHAEYIRYLQGANQPTQALDYWLTTLQHFPAVTRETLPDIRKMLEEKAAYDPYLREAARTLAGIPEADEYLELLKKMIGNIRTPDAQFALNFGILESRPDIDAFSTLLATMRHDWDSDYQVSTAAEFITIYPAECEKMLATIIQVYTRETDRETLKEGLEKELQRGQPSAALLGIQARIQADEGNLAESAKLFGTAAEKATGILKAALGICQARTLAVDNPDQARKILAAIAKSADAGPLAETARNLAGNPIAELPFKDQGGEKDNQIKIIR